MGRNATAIWILILAAGLALVARPTARGAMRVYDDFVAASVWKKALADPSEDTPGAPCAWLSCPAIGLDTLVIAGADPDRLHRAPCLDIVGVGANTVIVAHRDTHFAPLRDIVAGDRLTLQDRRGIVRLCEVERTLILPADEAEEFILGSPPDAALILVTCHPFDYFGPAPDRFIVVASPLSASGR